MSPVYPEESKRLDVISHLEELRRRILWSLAAIVTMTIAAFFIGDRILEISKGPVKGLVDNLIFIGPAEAFTSYLKVTLLAGFIASFPVVLYHLWAFLSPAFDKRLKKRIALWIILALILFFTGIMFAYFLAIPASLKFLIGFGRDIAVPAITLGRYVSFFGALILVGGIIFEIPVAMGLLSDAGIISSSMLRKKRHYAALGIMIFAAVITPTQDIMNMLLFSLPMIALYEVGIFIAKIVETREKLPNQK
ncbi:MAG: twin-arginine translocase subunit TatC [Candidatus Aadella gelida]|nr:twin-arginine translocase subunit TatC [Candidatus Aadella gelida]